VARINDSQQPIIRQAKSKKQKTKNKISCVYYTSNVLLIISLKHIAEVNIILEGGHPEGTQ